MTTTTARAARIEAAIAAARAAMQNNNGGMMTILEEEEEEEEESSVLSASSSSTATTPSDEEEDHADSRQGLEEACHETTTTTKAQAKTGMVARMVANFDNDKEQQKHQQDRNSSSSSSNNNNNSNQVIVESLDTRKDVIRSWRKRAMVQKQSSSETNVSDGVETSSKNITTTTSSRRRKNRIVAILEGKEEEDKSHHSNHVVEKGKEDSSKSSSSASKKQGGSVSKTSNNHIAAAIIEGSCKEDKNENNKDEEDVAVTLFPTESELDCEIDNLTAQLSTLQDLRQTDKQDMTSILQNSTEKILPKKDKRLLRAQTKLVKTKQKISNIKHRRDVECIKIDIQQLHLELLKHCSCEVSSTSSIARGIVQTTIADIMRDGCSCCFIKGFVHFEESSNKGNVEELMMLRTRLEDIVKLFRQAIQLEVDFNTECNYVEGDQLWLTMMNNYGYYSVKRQEAIDKYYEIRKEYNLSTITATNNKEEVFEGGSGIDIELDSEVGGGGVATTVSALSWTLSEFQQ